MSLGMEHDENKENPNLFANLNEEIDDDSQPSIGLSSRALVSRPENQVSVVHFKVLSIDMGQFVAIDLSSSVTVDDLDFVRAMYQIPSSATHRIPKSSEHACSSLKDEVCLSYGAFKGGLCLPFPHIVREVLNHFRLTRAHIVPNSYRHLRGCAAL